jgi:hypothetical protein
MYPPKFKYMHLNVIKRVMLFIWRNTKLIEKLQVNFSMHFSVRPYMVRILCLLKKRKALGYTLGTGRIHSWVIQNQLDWQMRPACRHFESWDLHNIFFLLTLIRYFRKHATSWLNVIVLYANIFTLGRHVLHHQQRSFSSNAYCIVMHILTAITNMCC